MHKFISRCGLYCGACSSMLLHDKAEGDPTLKNFECEHEETACAGCNTMVNCEFISCCKTHGVDSCAFCADFPCAQITKFSHDEWPHHLEVLDNLSRLRQIGIEAWLEEMRKAWSCPQCGARTHWYQSKCSACDASWEPKYV